MSSKNIDLKIPEIDNDAQIVEIKDNNLVYQSNYQKFLDLTPEITKQAEKALDNIKNAKDETDIKLARKESKVAKTYQHVIAQAEKYVKKVKQAEAQAMIDQLHHDLDKSGATRLFATLDEIKQCEQDVINQRKIKRWKEIEDTFNKEIKNYPNLKDLDFNWFKQRHEKLISGAVSRKVTDNDRMLVNNELHQLSLNIDAVEQIDQQGLFDDQAREMLKDTITQIINDDEDGGLSGFNTQIADALKATNDRRIQAPVEPQTDDSTPIDIQDESTDETAAPEDDSQTTNEESPTSIAESNYQEPVDDDLPPLPEESPDNIDFQEDQNIPYSDDEMHPEMDKVEQLINEANTSLYNGALCNTDDPVQHAKAKANFIGLTIDALEDPQGDQSLTYIHDSLAEFDDNTHQVFFTLIDKVTKL